MELPSLRHATVSSVMFPQPERSVSEQRIDQLPLSNFSSVAHNTAPIEPFKNKNNPNLSSGERNGTAFQRELRDPNHLLSTVF